MRKEMSSVVSQVPGVGGGGQRDHFLSHQHLGFLVFDDITRARASGGADCAVCVCLMYLTVCCQAQ